MTIKPARRTAIDSFLAMDVFADATKMSEAGADIIHFSIGQPSAQPPQAVLDAVALHLRQPPGYTDARGIAPLRARIARHYVEQYGVTVSPEQVFVTVGASGAYMAALLSAFQPGDRIALVSPYYPASPNMMRALGMEPVILHADAASNYQPTVAMLEGLKEKPQGLIIASPSNPAGTVIDLQELKALADYCERQDIMIISDEIYHGIIFGQARAATVLEYSRRMIVTNSFSKYYLLPGWRLGWAVMPEALCAPVEALLQNFYISPPALSQYAALEALEHRDYFDRVVQGYDRNRQILLEELPKAGFNRLSQAQGAFYLYADVSELTDDARDFCRRMLHEAHVCAVPGLDFDREYGGRFVRFSYSGSESAMREGAERVKKWQLAVSLPLTTNC